MKYSVIIDCEGMTISEIPELTKKEAIKTAKAEASIPSMVDSKVFVTWFRPSDQQHGYLNRDGNHEITGRAW